MFHVELRQFPHNACAFNLDDRALAAIVEPWAREQMIEVGERKWSPHLAKLTILEGPELPLGQLSMGRGWRNAERHSDDVTERVLATAHAAAAPMQARSPAEPTGAPAEQPAAGAPQASPGGADALALGVQIATLLGAEPLRLLEAWRQAAERSPELHPSETLALAEHALRADSPQA